MLDRDIFNKISLKEIKEIVLKKYQFDNNIPFSIHHYAAKIVNTLLEKVFTKQLIENTSLCLIAFKNFQLLYDEIYSNCIN